ncbi:MAG: cyclic nucleotide-binding domain-containing protein [Cyanobacteria bacterium P01_D01_bin.128]
MSDVLLRELTNPDLDWLVNVGKHDAIAPQQVMLCPTDPWDNVYVLVDGEVCLFRKKEDARPLTGIDRGEVFGESPLFDLPCPGTLKTVKPSQVISIPREVLTQKLHADVAFAAHFYRAIAVMLSERLRNLFEMTNQLQMGRASAAKEALSIFGELRDSDVDWLTSTGKIEKVAANQVLLQAGRPIDGLYMVLDGRFSIAVPDGAFSPLAMCMAKLEERSRSYRLIAEISKGGFPGIVAFLDSRPMPVTIRSVTEALIFTVPRPAMVVKLQTDLGFAARLYRVMAVQISELLQAVLDQISGSAIAPLRSSDGEAMEDDELDLDDLQQMSEGAARFNWMLDQLGLAS